MSTLTTSLRGCSARSACSGAVIALLATISSGCSTTGTSDVDPAGYDSLQRHPILISRDPEALNLPVGMRGPALSPQIERAVRDYVRQYKSDGTGPITIQTPVGSANEHAAADTGRAIHYALVRAGVPHGQIVVAPYEAGNKAKTATLRLAYLRVKAVVPSCGLWPDRYPASVENTQTYDFGCSAQQNLAAMVADTGDLVRPRATTPANGARRANVIQFFVDHGNIGWEPEPAKGLLGTDAMSGG
jgi:pilus assembly protein CpaD